MFHKKWNFKKEQEKKTRQLLNREKEIWKSKIDEWVELETPYHDGYYFTLTINDMLTKNFSEKNLEELKYIENKFIHSEIYPIKRPYFVQKYNVYDDRIWYLDKKKKEHWSPGFFSIISENEFNKIPEQFKHLFSLMYHRTPFTDIEYKRYTVYHEYRKFFNLKRYKRIITHKKLIDGELESKQKKIGEKLWYSDKMAYKYANYPRHEKYWYYNEKEMVKTRSFVIDEDAL